MVDMRVKMFLDLVNNTKGGAAQAKREMKGVKDAARDLNRQEAGKKITRDILAIANHSKGAARGLREVKGAAAGIGSDGASARLARDLEKARTAAARLRAELRGVKQQSVGGQGRDGQGRFTGGAGGAGSTLLPGTRGMLGGYLGIQAARASARGTVGQSVSFEKAMADVIKKVDLPEGQTQADLEKMITGSAIKFGRSREQIAGLAAELGAAGVGYTDLGRAIAQATRASVAWDMTPSETGESLAKIRTQHQMSLDQLDEFIDKVNALADTSASKERDIVEMFQRAAAGAKVADVDRDPSLAFLTAMNAGGMQPEIAARGFGAMVSKLRTAKSSGGKKMAEGLKMLGLTPGQVEKGMKTDSLKTLIDLMGRFEKSSDKAAVAVKMFGEGWWDEFSRMVQSAPEIAKNLRLLKDTSKWKGSSDKTLAIELETTDNHLKRLAALATDVGDRLGRWALPPINAAIEQLIAGMDALDKRAADKTHAEDLAQKKARGTPLTPEEREKLARDRQLAAGVNRRGNQLSAQQDYAETSARIEGSDDTAAALSERAQLLRRQLERQINSLETELKLTPDAVGPAKRQRLKALKRQLADIPTSPYDKRIGPQDPRRPADMTDRFQVDDREALRERMRQLESRLQALKDLADSSSNAADKEGFNSDARPVRSRREQALRQLLGYLAPNATAAGRFGTAPGGAPANAPTRATGSGLTGFGLNGLKAAGDQWKEGIRSSFEIDLGDAGTTMMERLRSGIAAGGAGAVSAATGVKDGVQAALSGADLAAAGQAAMATYAAGIRAGTPAAVAAALGAAAQVKGALGSGGGGRKAISGALHDGVD